MSKLSAPDWATVVTMFQRGEKTVRELAEMFKVSPQSIHEGLKRRGVSRASKISDLLVEAEDEASAAYRKKVADAHLIADRFAKYIDVLAQLAVKKIMDANGAGGIHSANADLIALKNGMAIIAKAREESWTIHKIDEMLQQDEALATLNVGEYTEEELEAIRAGNEEAYVAAMDEVENLDVNLNDDDDYQDDES